MKLFSNVNSQGTLTFSLLAIAHLPMLIAYFIGLATQDHYHFFPFALVATGWFGWKRIDWNNFAWNRVSLVLASFDLLLLVGSCVLNSPWLACVGFLFLVAAVSWSADHGGRRPYELALVFLTVVRPPVGADVQLIQWLQPFTSRMAGTVLDTLGIVHVVSGNIIDLADKSLFVEEACSGVQSLFAILFVAAFIVAWQKRSPLHAILMLISAPICAISMNIARVAAIAIAWEWSGADLSEGLSHELLGYLLLTIATLFLFSADRCFRFVGSPVEEDWFIQNSHTSSNPFALIWNQGWSSLRSVGQRTSVLRPTFLGVTAAVGFVLISAQCYSIFASESRTAIVRTDLSLTPPEKLGRFEFIDDQTEVRSVSNSQGEYSRIWNYRGPGTSCRCSFDFPFVGWHDLRVCYRGLGWRVEDYEVSSEEWPVFSFRMSKPTGEHGYVTFSMMKSAGRPFRPPNVTDPGAGLVSRLAKGGLLGQSETTYQSQAFFVSAVPFSTEELKEFHEMHRMARGIAQKALLSSGGEDE